MIKKGINKIKGYLTFGKSSPSQALTTSGEILGSFDQAIIGHVGDAADTGFERCLNCDQPTTNYYCANCGQSKADMKRPIWYLISDFTDDLISPEGKLQKTIALLLFMPGALTRNFIDGKRARYIPPIRFYLVSTLFFFLTMWVADVAVFKIEFSVRDEEKVEVVREASYEGLMGLLRRNNIELRPKAESAEEASIEPVAEPEAVDDIGAGSVSGAPNIVNLSNSDMTEEEINQIVQEAIQEQEENQAAIEAAQEGGENGFDEEKLENRLANRELFREVRSALRALSPDRGRNVDIIIPDDLSTEQLEQISKQVENFADAYDIADGTNNTVSYDGIRYNIVPSMFAPLAPSSNAVGLPPETFANAQQEVVRNFDEGEIEIIEEIRQLRAKEASGLGEYLALEKDLFFAETAFEFMETFRGITLQAMDGMVVVSQDPQTLNRTLNDRMSQAMVILLPLFAFMTKFFYWGRENNLMKQLVFSLHFHSYIFIIMAILVIAQVLVGASVSTYMFVLAVPVYLFIAMKVASKQGWFKTIFKFFAVSILYLIVLLIVFVLTIVISLSDLAPSQRSPESQASEVVSQDVMPVEPTANDDSDEEATGQNP